MVAVLTAAAIAAAGATAGATTRGGPAGGHSEPERSAPPHGLYGPAGAVAPSQWLRLSNHTFQRLMRMLAERSAQLGGRETAPFGPPAPPDVREPEESAPPEHEPAAPAGPGTEPWDRDRGGEARAGHNRPTGAVRVRDWHRRSRRSTHRYRPRSCRKAGKPVGRDGWYVVAHGDTLWTIAEAHYGYGGGYRRILRANRQRIVYPGLIYPCQRLRIPVW